MISKEEIQNFGDAFTSIQLEIGKEMIGQALVIDQLLMAMIAGGNVLLEGVPGLGKTRLVRTLSKVLDLPFSRIQFTPDLMPADITGTNMVVKGEHGNEFQFQQGPLFAALVLADEINRATPKTQSALLEAMQEHHVTVGGITRPLPEPYFVMATQNPLEQEGTYPLPEAQLDRFMVKIKVDFPTLDELGEIVGLTTVPQVMAVNTIANGESLLRMREIAASVPIAKAVQTYALTLVLHTHPELSDAPETTCKFVRYGASPRAAQAIISMARVRALIQKRYNVSFEDIDAVAYPCLRHRIALNFEGLTQNKTVEGIITELMQRLMKNR